MIDKQPPKTRALRSVLLWTIFIFVTWIFVLQMLKRGERTVDIPYSIFQHELAHNNVSRVTFTEKSIRGTFKAPISYGENQDFAQFTTLMPFEDPALTDALVKANVEVVAKQKSSWTDIVITIIPWVLIIGVWVFFIRQMQSGQNRALGFGRSRAKIILENKPSVTFNDVAGVEEAKQELEEVIEFLKEPRKFTRLGGRIPKGVLLLGPRVQVRP